MVWLRWFQWSHPEVYGLKPPVNNSHQNTTNVHVSWNIRITYRICFQIISISNEGRSGEAVDQCHTQMFISTWPGWFKSSPPGQNGHPIEKDIFRCIVVNEKFCILIKISLKFVPKNSTDYNPALVQIMAWRRIGDKPLSEPMLTRLTDAYMRH